MNLGKNLYRMLMAASMAHARWDYETSMNILKDKKRLYLLGLMLLPAILTSLAFAAELPSALGGYKAYTPAFYSTNIFIVSILVGLCAGLITGCIGAGGGFIITPAMSAGVKGILAGGPTFFTYSQKPLWEQLFTGNWGTCQWPWRLRFLVGSGIGVTGGGFINRALYEYNPVVSDAFISVVYVVLLGFLGFYSLADFLTLRKAEAGVGAHVGESVHGEEAATGKIGLPANYLKIPPLITFDEDLIPVADPALFVAVCGAVVGFVAAIMGVGGSFTISDLRIYPGEYPRSQLWGQTYCKSFLLRVMHPLPNMRSTGLSFTHWLWACFWVLGRGSDRRPYHKSSQRHLH